MYIRPGLIEGERERGVYFRAAITRQDVASTEQLTRRGDPTPSSFPSLPPFSLFPFFPFSLFSLGFPPCEQERTYGQSRACSMAAARAASEALRSEQGVLDGCCEGCV